MDVDIWWGWQFSSCVLQAIADYQNGRLGTIPGREEREQQTKQALALQRQNGSFTDLIT